MSDNVVFVYGTLKMGWGNSVLLKDAEFIGPAKTVGSHFTMMRSGIPFVYDKGVWRISGELYRCDDETLARLDRLEGHPNFYERKQYPVVTADEEVHTAWIYICAGSLADGYEATTQVYN